LLLHLKRFIVVEKPQPVVGDNSCDKAAAGGGGGGDENAHPNSPSSRRSRPVEYEFQKNKAPVEISERLSLEHFLSTSDETEESCLSAGEYKLQSIVHHIGSRASSGHYTADALRLSKDLPGQDDEDDKNKEEGDSNNNIKEGDRPDKSGTPNTKHDGVGPDFGAAATADKQGNCEEPSSAASAPGQEQEEWISFDDTNSGRNTFANIAGSNFKQRTAYMLLYKFSPSAAASTGATPRAPFQESCKATDDLDSAPAKPAPVKLQ
jgi:Ubiquitin carboxyl-terminal hydrolase